MNNQNNFLFSTILTLDKNTELSLADLLEEVTILVKDVLQHLANQSDFMDKIQLAFGENADGNKLTINYNAFDPDSEAQIKLFYDDLFYDDYDQDFDRTLITDNLLETDGAGRFLENNNTGIISDSLLTVSDFPSTGDILGTVWDDVDGDGVFDTAEIGLSGWTVYLDQNQNGQLDLGETSTITDNNGDYSFIGLSPDTYYVAEVVQNGWEQTHLNISNLNSLQIDPIQITTTDSNIPITTSGEIIATSDEIPVVPESNVSGPLININDFRGDLRFNGIDGNGLATVILDSGIDLNHPFFGSDSDNNGIADRIVYQYDFADNDSDASDVNGHGSNVSSIVASSDSTYTGVAPGADIIHLKVFEDSGGGNFSYVEQALQWVIANAATYNIASVNMSLGDNGNYTTAQNLYGISDELAALAAMNVMVVSASGNNFYSSSSALGVAYPSADPNSLSIGAVYDGNLGGFNYSDGAIAYSTGADRITPFSQRHNDLTTIFAPGAAITGAGPNGGIVTQHGTSQASPHVSGVAVLAQQLAQQKLGRSLTLNEFSNLLASSGVTINDGDDENDNVTNSNLNFPRLDVLALGEAILAMASNTLPGTHTVNLSAGDTVSDMDFGNQQTDTQGTPENDFLLGTPNNDRINGWAGNDTLVGGDGNDNLQGNEGVDVLNGGGGRDTLNGGGGRDTLQGQGGQDILIGGSANDIFVFDTGTVFDSSNLGLDRILDFVVGGDKIRLSKDTFTALDNTNNGRLRNSDFAVVTSNSLADNNSAEIVYNSSNGNLYYNENNAANGFGDGGLFAKLIGSPDDLSASDFQVVDV